MIGSVRYEKVGEQLMEKIIIYGAGNRGRSAYFFLKGQYECLFFVDSDEEKWGTEIENLQVKPPCILEEQKDTKIFIASSYWKEILETIKNFDCLEILIFKPEVDKYEKNEEKITDELDKRTIDFGFFLKEQGEIKCKELTFMPGGSGILDYAFINAFVKKYHCKTYLEIGTYIGESINILTDYCERLYSITAPCQEKYSMASWCRNRNLPDYSERLAQNDKIIHFYTDSKEFDYMKIKDEIDLYFIDGDHSYEGVYADTKNVFKIKNENAIVVWHDFRDDVFRYNMEVVNGVKDALGEKFENVYVTNGNLCGIYIPDKYRKDFKLKKLQYGINEELYVYDVKLENCQVM